MEPGLYNINDKLLYTWKELKDYGIIKIIDNKLTNAALEENEGNKLVIDKGITELSEFCLYSNSLSKIVIGPDVKIIPTSFFDDKTIDYIDVDINNPYFSSEDGVLFNKDKTKLIRYPEQKKNETYTIPETVKKLEIGAFYGNRYLLELKMNDNIEILPEYCFAESIRLINIILSKNIKRIEACAFMGCESINELYFHDGLQKIFDEAFYSAYNLKKITIPNSLKFITDLTFEESYFSELVYKGTKEEFKKIDGYKYFFVNDKIKEENIIYNKTLDELIKEGYNFIEANKIIKEQMER